MRFITHSDFWELPLRFLAIVLPDLATVLPLYWEGFIWQGDLVSNYCCNLETKIKDFSKENKEYAVSIFLFWVPLSKTEDFCFCSTNFVLLALGYLGKFYYLSTLGIPNLQLDYSMQFYALDNWVFWSLDKVAWRLLLYKYFCSVTLPVFYTSNSYFLFHFTLFCLF